MPIPLSDSDARKLGLKPSKSKYRAKRCEVDGVTFHSQKEARRYSELKMMEKAGKIEQLELQPKFAIEINGPQNMHLHRGFPVPRAAAEQREGQSKTTN
jgi:hypothetical protein